MILTNSASVKQFGEKIKVKLAVRKNKANDDGKANPDSNVTRAEACAMVMRLMGVDAIGKPDSGFEDVPGDSWYANTVARAKDYGIIEGDSDKLFSPDRNVSREEMVVMTARALQAVGFVELDENATRDDYYCKSDYSYEPVV